MFTNLRKSFKGFFAKLILLFLVAMFGVWGIGDVFRGMGRDSSTVATVGKMVISVPQFHQAVHQHRGEPQQQVLLSLINTLLIESEARSLGLVVGDDAVADFVRNIPDFHDKDGKFDKKIYLAVINNGGKGEQGFLDDIRHEVAAKLLLGPLTNNIQVPDETVQALYRAQEETRSANLLFMTSSPAAVEAAPTEQEIKTYYDAHSREFTAPETRTLSYVLLPVADVQAKIVPAEDEIKRVYEERKDEFRKPERKAVQDMTFDNEQDAKAASARLGKGEKFDAVAASAPVTNKGKTSLGMVSEQELPHDVAHIVYALKPETASAQLMVDFRWHVYQVGQSEAGRAMTLEEARPAIVSELAARQAQETLSKLAAGLEDTLAGGATLEQAADKIGQKLHQAGPVTREGMLAGEKKADLPTYDTFLATAFATAEKEHSQAVQAQDGSYFLVRVDAVVAEHTKALAEVKPEIIKDVLEQKKHEKLEKTALDISGQIHAGKKPADAIASFKISAETAPSGALKRAGGFVQGGPRNASPLPSGLMGELFRLNPGESTHAYPTGQNEYVLATLAQASPAPQKPDPKVLESIRDELRMTLKEEVLRQYLFLLHDKYPITVNAAALATKSGDSGE